MQLFKDSDILLEAKSLSHSFDYELFNDIDLCLRKSTAIAIVGVSGSGKSTILHILSTLLKPKRGKVFFRGNNIYSLNKESVLEIRRKYYGIIFQSHYLFRGFSADENLEVARILSNKEDDKELLKRLKIDKLVYQNSTQLSGGQQQRLSIARSLIKKPSVIFADEPTGNLDKETANEVMNILFEYIKENSAGMFLVTHDLDLALKCDEVYKLEDKKLKVIK